MEHRSRRGWRSALGYVGLGESVRNIVSGGLGDKVRVDWPTSPVIGMLKLQNFFSKILIFLKVLLL